MAGDSAGGNLAAVVAQRSADKIYAPRAQLLLYPTVDFKSRHPSFYAYNQGLVLSAQDIDLVTKLYAETHQVELDPLISPTYGELKNLPPAYVITARHDVLHDEGSIYALKLRENGVRVYLSGIYDQAHGFINLPQFINVEKQVIELSKNFP